MPPRPTCTNYKNLQRAIVAQYTSADGSSQQETVTVNTGSSPSDQGHRRRSSPGCQPTTWRITSASLNWLDHKYEGGLLDAILVNQRGTNPPVELSQFDVPFSPELKVMLNVVLRLGAEQTGKRVTLQRQPQLPETKAETDVFEPSDTPRWRSARCSTWLPRCTSK
jgi:hypothetical protein